MYFKPTQGKINSFCTGGCPDLTPSACPCSRSWQWLPGKEGLLHPKLFADILLSLLLMPIVMLFGTVGGWLLLT